MLRHDPNYYFSHSVLVTSLPHTHTHSLTHTHAHSLSHTHTFSPAPLSLPPLHAPHSAYFSLPLSFEISLSLSPSIHPSCPCSLTGRVCCFDLSDIRALPRACSGHREIPQRPPWDGFIYDPPCTLDKVHPVLHAQSCTHTQRHTYTHTHTQICTNTHKIMNSHSHTYTLTLIIHTSCMFVQVYPF